MQLAIRVALDIPPHQMFYFGWRSASLQVVSQRNDGKQNHDKDCQRHNLHTSAGAHRFICPPVLVPQPEAKKRDRERKPKQVEKHFQDISDCTGLISGRRLTSTHESF